VKTEPPLRHCSQRDLVAALHELVDSGGQQSDAELLFFYFPRYAHDHVANIFSRLLCDKFFALTGKWSNESQNE
jgi:hypothetical protein